MKFVKTSFKDLYLVEPTLYKDERGFFTENFRKDIFENNISYKIKICQHNIVESNFLVLRGLHYQIDPYTQSKLISVLSGRILDVVVDLRSNSKTYGKYFSVELSSKNLKSLFVPKGFAHGYLTLSKKALVSYKVDNYFNKESERGIRFDDEHLNIDWGINKKKFILSDKDKNLSNFLW